MSTPEQLVNELRARLGTIAGLHVPEWGVKATGRPAALIGFPQEINYDTGYRVPRFEVADWPVIILLPKAVERVGFLDSSAYVDRSGARSVRAALDSTPAAPYVHADFVKIGRVDFDPGAVYAGVPAAALVFHAHIMSN